MPVHLILNFMAVFALLLSTTGTAKAEPEPPLRSCVVKEVLDGGGYSYIRCQESGAEIWLGCLAVKLAPGGKISFPEVTALLNYSSKSLGRAFPAILMVPKISRLSEGTSPGAPQISEPVPPVYPFPEPEKEVSPEVTKEEDLLNEAFFQAITEGDLPGVLQGLGKGVKTEMNDGNGRTPLMLAAQHGYLDVVRALLAHQASLSARDIDGTQPLMFAAKGGHAGIVKLLLANHANVNEADYHGSSALMYACKEENLEIVRLLLASGADIEARDKEGLTALLVSYGSKPTLELLVAKGAKTGVVSGKGDTLLIQSVRSQYYEDDAERKKSLERIRYIIGLTPNLEARNNAGYTALISAYESTEVLELLANSGADLNARNNRGESAMMLAATGNYYDSVTVLLKHKADLNLADYGGHTALWYAGHCSINCSAVDEILQGKGAQLEIKKPEGSGLPCQQVNSELTFDLPGPKAHRQLLFLPNQFDSLTVLLRTGGSCRQVLAATTNTYELEMRVELKQTANPDYPDIVIKESKTSEPRGSEEILVSYLWNGAAYERKGHQESAVLNRKALALMTKGKLTEAIALWNKAYDLVRDSNVEMVNNLGFAYYTQGLKSGDEKSFAFAKLYLHETISRDKKRWQAYLNLADLHSETGEKAEAIQYYEKALALKPGKVAAAKIKGKLETLARVPDQLVEMTVVQERIREDLPLYSFRVEGESEEGATQKIVITDSSSGKIMQKIDVAQECEEVDPDLGENVLTLQDVNFDGYKDISLVVSRGGTGNSVSAHWLYEPRIGKFVFSEAFSSLGTLTPDPEAKQISTHSNGGHAGMIHSESIYEVRENKPVLVRETDQDYDDKQGYYVEVVSELVQGTMKVTSKKVVH